MTIRGKKKNNRKGSGQIEVTNLKHTGREKEREREMLLNLTVLASVKGLYSSRPPGGTDWVTCVTEGSYWTERMGIFYKGGTLQTPCKRCTFPISGGICRLLATHVMMSMHCGHTLEAHFNVLITWQKSSQHLKSPHCPLTPHLQSLLHPRPLLTIKLTSSGVKWRLKWQSGSRRQMYGNIYNFSNELVSNVHNSLIGG